MTVQKWGVRFRATRPAFLTITLLACCIGFAAAAYDGRPASAALGAAAAVLALLGHAGANLINDYSDSLSGCDAGNNKRIAPYTGGSRFIQDGLLTEAQVRRSAILLFLVMVCCGVVLSAFAAWRLLAVGAVGLTLGWGYSMPPLRLMTRGLLGEIAIVASTTRRKS